MQKNFLVADINSVEDQHRHNVKRLSLKRTKEQKERAFPWLAAKVIHDENCPSAELVCQLHGNLYPDAAF